LEIDSHRKRVSLGNRLITEIGSPWEKVASGNRFPAERCFPRKYVKNSFPEKIPKNRAHLGNKFPSEKGFLKK
jgi:hypothetical protein